MSDFSFLLSFYFLGRNGLPWTSAPPLRSELSGRWLGGVQCLSLATRGQCCIGSSQVWWLKRPSVLQSSSRGKPLALSGPFCGPLVRWSVRVYTVKSSFAVWGPGSKKHWAWIPVGIWSPSTFFHHQYSTTLWLHSKTVFSCASVVVFPNK